eukprot:3148844-Heterocapsa_arctica.AAC.1
MLEQKGKLRTLDLHTRAATANRVDWGIFFQQHHTKKDDKDMWCNEKGYTIENIAGYGNCLYACLGRSRKLTGDRVRQIIHDNADRLWSTHMQHD